MQERDWKFPSAGRSALRVQQLAEQAKYLERRMAELIRSGVPLERVVVWEGEVYVEPEPEPYQWKPGS